MIIIIGPPGAGKSVQSDLLATEYGWTWLSVGRLLRETNDPELTEIMNTGQLVPVQKSIGALHKAIDKSPDPNKVVVDGFPREQQQAEWIVEQSKEGHKTDLILVLELSEEASVERLALRGRDDDKTEVIRDRRELYEKEIQPLLEYLASNNIKIETVNGEGSVEEVHERVVEELKKCQLI
jgi:adenylate kinase family enzyme